MDSKKTWYQSKGVWAGIITVAITMYNAAIPAVVQMFSYTLPAIPGWMYGILGVFGLYARITATQKIGG